MIRPQDFFGASPKSVLSRPFFHCQDVKGYNVDGGTSIADAWTKRTLNTVIYNDISGATLSSDAVNLPAGTYYVEGSAVIYGLAASSSIAIFKDGVRSSLQSINKYDTSTGNSPSAETVAGVVTLSSPGVIDIRYYIGVGTSTNGLGVSNNAGSITDASINSIYADLKIWQLDRSLEIAPKAVNSGLQAVAGLNTEGGVEGFDVTVSGNTLTIGKGTCMSSDKLAALAFTADETCVLPGTVNGDFYVFAVRLLDGVTFEARAYSTDAGPSSDAQIDKWRLVSFAKNNGSGVTMPFVQNGDRIDWLTSTNRPILTSSTTASYVSYNLSAIIPVSIFKDVSLNSDLWIQYISLDGTTPYTGISYNLGDVANAVVPAIAGIYIKYDATSAVVSIVSATLRR